MSSELLDLIRPGAGRGLDFVILDELRKRTGITPAEILKFAASEMLCNSLDTDATEIHIEARTVGVFDEVTVKDNGSKKISLDELRLILDFSNKASSKRGFLRVSRGYLGNALKCLMGYSYALAEPRKLPPPEGVVKTHGMEHRIALKPDRVREIIGPEIASHKTNERGFNSFSMKFPIGRTRARGQPREPTEGTSKERGVIHDIIFASAMVNPTRRLVYDLWGVKGVFGEPTGTPPLRKDTSILWYSPKQFNSLFTDFVRARPETQLKEFVSLFRGFTSKKRHGEILQELNDAGNHDSHGESPVQFFPATSIEALSPDCVEKLYFIMRERAKPISKRSVHKVLGSVGEERFEKVKEQHEWRRLKYTIVKGRKEGGYASFPFLIELAVFDRREDDTEGLKVFQCVNFMASMEDIFSKLFNIKYRLGRVGITEKSPVTVVAHLVCPVLKWLNYGKSGLYE